MGFVFRVISTENEKKSSWKCVFLLVCLTLAGFQLICLKAVLAPFRMLKLETSAQVYQQTRKCEGKKPAFVFVLARQEWKRVRRNHPFEKKSPFVTSAVRRQLLHFDKGLTGTRKRCVSFLFNFILETQQEGSGTHPWQLWGKKPLRHRCLLGNRGAAQPSLPQPVHLFSKYTRFLLRSKANK